MNNIPKDKVIFSDLFRVNTTPLPIEFMPGEPLLMRDREWRREYELGAIRKYIGGLVQHNVQMQKEILTLQEEIEYLKAAINPSRAS